MEALTYIIAILGCGDGAALCEPVRNAPVAYSSRSACEAAVPATLEGSADVSYPVVMARCEQRGVQVASRDTTRG